MPANNHKSVIALDNGTPPTTLVDGLLVTYPWIPLEKVKEQLRLYQDDSQDSQLLGYIESARVMVEKYLGISFYSQTFRATYGADTYLYLPVLKGSILTIVRVGYYADSDTGIQVTDLVQSKSNGFIYDSSSNRIVITNTNLNYSPLAEYSFEVDYKYAPSDPMILAIDNDPRVLAAGLMMITHLYNNPGLASDQKASMINPVGFEALLAELRRF